MFICVFVFKKKYPTNSLQFSCYRLSWSAGARTSRYMWNILLSSKTVSCLSSVPDLSEYRVWLGASDIREGAPDWSNRQEVSIAHVICGPEGSSLALIRLSKWVPGKTISKIYRCIFVCVCVRARCWSCCVPSRPALPADNVHTIQLPVAGCSIPEGRLCKMYGWGETKGIDILYSTSTAAVVSKSTLQVSQVANISHVFAFPLLQDSIIRDF